MKPTRTVVLSTDGTVTRPRPSSDVHVVHDGLRIAQFTTAGNRVQQCGGRPLPLQHTFLVMGEHRSR